jgi:hypothetical protein
MVLEDCYVIRARKDKPDNSVRVFISKDKNGNIFINIVGMNRESVVSVVDVLTKKKGTVMKATVINANINQISKWLKYLESVDKKFSEFDNIFR